MNIKEIQAALGIRADGVVGPVTVATVIQALHDGRLSVVMPVPLAPKAGILKRVIMHWTAGTYSVSGLDRKHYHFIIDGDGNEVRGDRTPEDNISASDGRYAAHTQGANTGAIGVSVAAMHGATQSPFNAGPYPITPKQLDALCGLVSRLCREYGIPITRETVLTHAEVQITLGIMQNGKWDISWLPGMTATDAPVFVGDKIRAMISAKM